eukprot:CAMPEP_0174322764 /NCGR_PEP_ID=MMETSP0810-20121108/11254_1 /TAXON_ID=73025 ORGANISM="Eutreptiella gymnastica-like, Strain CCMP1594" /NCGR_SAMPLE_ID=MMETSP0810 /ASSEMBLY_ACC=CAM_ASM_000659 /LENGTH=54 /DNA_ID=CAMNT_0015434759 /DNA_START=2140 /DNA_END=2300 /DNA_ORIENTATION=+
MAAVLHDEQPAASLAGQIAAVVQQIAVADACAAGTADAAAAECAAAAAAAAAAA